MGETDDELTSSDGTLATKMEKGGDNTDRFGAFFRSRRGWNLPPVNVMAGATLHRYKVGRVWKKGQRQTEQD